MAKFAWLKSGAASGLQGETLAEILNRYTNEFCAWAEIGSAAGSRLTKVVAKRSTEGSKESCLLTITAQGWPLAGETEFGPEKSGTIRLICAYSDFEEGEMELKRHGGARPGAGAKPQGEGAKVPITERFPPLAAAYIKCQSSGYLTRLVEADMQKSGQHHGR